MQTVGSYIKYSVFSRRTSLYDSNYKNVKV